MRTAQWSNRRKGSLGEGIAVKYLVSMSFVILHRNYSTPFGEIDIVAKKNGYTVFVEVKTRTSFDFGSPLLSVTRAKQRSIRNNVLYYMKRHGTSDEPSRIDVIGIVLDINGKLLTMEHIENAIWV